MGIEGLKKIILASGELINVITKVLNKEGILVTLELLDEVNALAGLKIEDIKAELLDLSHDERLELQEVLKAKLVLPNKGVEVKIEEGADIINSAVDVIESALVVVERVKKLFSGVVPV